MSRKDDLDTLDTWTRPENLKPLTFWQALWLHLALTIALVTPFAIFLATLAWVVAQTNTAQ